MLCSKCSEKVRPIVAVDIDGTLGDYHGHFIEFASRYLDRTVPGGYAGTREFSDELGLEKSVYREIKLAYRQGGMKRTMPIFPGAAEFVNGLRDHEIEVWITTTRPYLRLDNIDPDTRHWLERHEIGFDGLLFNENKYEHLAAIVDPARILAVVDDQIEMVLRAHDIGLKAFYMRTYWNRGIFTEMESVDKFSVLTERVAERLYNWRVLHGA